MEEGISRVKRFDVCGPEVQAPAPLAFRRIAPQWQAKDVPEGRAGLVRLDGIVVLTRVRIRFLVQAMSCLKSVGAADGIVQCALKRGGGTAIRSEGLWPRNARIPLNTSEMSRSPGGSRGERQAHRLVPWSTNSHDSPTGGGMSGWRT